MVFIFILLVLRDGGEERMGTKNWLKKQKYTAGLKMGLRSHDMKRKKVNINMRWKLLYFYSML